jgi:hypothetical protein
MASASTMEKTAEPQKLDIYQMQLWTRKWEDALRKHVLEESDQLDLLQTMETKTEVLELVMNRSSMSIV